MSHSLNEKIIPVVIAPVGTETVAEAFIRQVIAVATENSKLTAQGTSLYYDANTGIKLTASSATSVVAKPFAFGVEASSSYTYSSLSEGTTRYVHLHESTNETVLCFKLTSDGISQQLLMAIFAEADGDTTVFSYHLNGNLYITNSNTSSSARLDGISFYTDAHLASINKMADVWHGKVFDELFFAQSVPQIASPSYLVAFSTDIYALKCLSSAAGYTKFWLAFPVSDET